MTILVARCPHCGQQHPKEVKTCPATGQAMPGALTIGELLGGRYRVRHYLGEGGLGGLWEADAGGGRIVTVEVAHPDFANNSEALSGFYEEARPVGPHIAQILDAGRAGDGSPYLVLEPLDGVTLAGRMNELGGRLPFARAAHIIRQVLEALAPLHRQGVVHRALAPEHIYLSQQDGDADYVKLLSFGFARLVGETARARDLAAGLGYALPYFLSPEQVTQAPTDHRVDIYSCGVLLYTMIAGQPPYQGKDVANVLGAVQAGRYHPLRAFVPDLPPELEQAIGYAMALDPGHRYQNAEHLMQTLAPFAQASPATGGRERTLNRETPAPVAAQMDEITPKTPSKIVPIGVGFALAVAVLGVLLAVRGGGGKAPASDGTEVAAKTTTPEDKPAADKPPPSPPPEDKPVATPPPEDKPAATATPDAGGTTAAVAATPDAGKPAATAAATPDAGAKAATAATTPDAGGKAATVAVTPPPKPKAIVLTFNVKPREAKITVDGKEVTGKVELPPGDKPVKVVVSAPGYVAYEQSISVKADDKLDIELKKQATATATPPPVDKPPPSKPPTTTKKPPKKPKIEL